MRNRLIELLENSPHLDTLDGTYEKAVDYLLKNGVIVPPCKIGEDIWVPNIMRDEAYKTKAIAFTHDVITDPYDAIPFCLVSTTKEEAEKHLGGVQE